MVHVAVIIAFAALFIRDLTPGPILGAVPLWAAAFTLGSMLLIFAAADVFVALRVRAFKRTGSPGHVASAELACTGARLVALFVHVACVIVVGWFDAVRSVVGDLPAIDELIAVTPVLAIFVGTWWSMYPVEAHIRDVSMLRSLDTGEPMYPTPTRLGYVLMQVRHQLCLIVVPIAAIMAWHEGLIWAGTRWLGLEAHDPTRPLPAGLYAAQLAGTAAVFAMVPLVMTRIWDTTPLADGPLRRSLMETCRRCGVRVTRLLLWRTDGMMVNGAVMGFFPPWRYVLLTDALLDSLRDDQTQAVMAHELAHVRRRHMYWLAIALAGAMVAGEVVVGSASGAVLGPMAPASAWTLARDLAGLVLVFGGAMLVFGYVSRRFEWQADAFAAAHLSDGEFVTAEASASMVGALDAVAYLNHLPKDRFTWRHGTIAERQRRLNALVGTPVDSLPIDSTVTTLKTVMLIILALSVWAVV